MIFKQNKLNLHQRELETLPPATKKKVADTLEKLGRLLEPEFDALNALAQHAKFTAADLYNLLLDYLDYLDILKKSL